MLQKVSATKRESPKRMILVVFILGGDQYCYESSSIIIKHHQSLSMMVEYDPINIPIKPHICLGMILYVVVVCVILIPGFSWIRRMSWTKPTWYLGVLADRFALTPLAVNHSHKQGKRIIFSL